MTTNRTMHEFDFHFTHRVEHDLSPLFRSLIMALFDDLNAKVDDVRTQVMTAIDALKGGAGGDTSLSLTADQKTQLLSKLDDLTTAVKSAITTTTGTTGTTDVTGTTAPGGTATPDVTGTVPPTPAGPTPAPAAPNPNPTPGP